jgi:hypothetical protein
MEQLRNKVYVAGPYSAETKEGRLENTLKAVAAGDRLRAAGYVPFIPHLYHWWHEYHPHPYQFWMDLDQVWLEASDILCRIDGESPGGDTEIGWARQLRMFHGVDDLLKKLGICANPRMHTLG